MLSLSFVVVVVVVVVFDDCRLLFQNPCDQHLETNDFFIELIDSGKDLILFGSFRWLLKEKMVDMFHSQRFCKLNVGLETS